jgi:aryl-alcohol dehydrogenase-like predicted oxidoreductase
MATSNRASFEIVEGLRGLADEAGVSLVSVAIGGLAAQPAVASVIAGATSAEQVAQNAEAADWVPSPDERRRIDEITNRTAPAG